MFKPARIFSVLLLLLVALTLPALAAAEEEDRYFPLSNATKDTFSTYFLDFKTLQHVPADANFDFIKNPEQVYKDKGYLQAWVKVEYEKNGAKEVVESLKMQERNIAGYDRLAFSLQLLRVRPATKEVALLEQADYDKNGKVLGRIVHPTDRWVPYDVEARIKEICEKLVVAQRAFYANGGR
ncbi:MAG: hypothetical protein RIN56_11250 [Sporomusaceae bacterium]|nr:hypothetical protein [Sporomusaceae bacterium]